MIIAFINSNDQGSANLICPLLFPGGRNIVVNVNGGSTSSLIGNWFTRFNVS